MLQGEHSAILFTFIKQPFVIKIFVLSIFVWSFYTGFTVLYSFTIEALPFYFNMVNVPKNKMFINKMLVY